MAEFRPACPSDLPALRTLWKAAFSDDDKYLDIFFSTAYAPERSRVVCQDDEIVGGAYWLDCSLGAKKLAYVYAVAIAEDCRGQGLGSMLMEDIHRILTQQNYAGVILVPGDEDLRRYYQRFGYRNASPRRIPVQLSSLPMERISPERYALLRRTYLPEDGILQEGENLALLGAMADFFQGDGFITVISGQQQCLELLGNTAPVAVEEQPYAMVRELSGSLPENLYFAFGFD